MPFHVNSQFESVIHCFETHTHTYTEFNKSGDPAGHQVRILWGPAEIYTLPVRMSDTIFLEYK